MSLGASSLIDSFQIYGHLILIYLIKLFACYGYYGILYTKSATSKAVHPLIPITVIKNRLLYLNRFLAVTFCENFNLVQTKFNLSSRIRWPALGALGLNRRAGVSINSLRQADRVAMLRSYNCYNR